MSNSNSMALVGAFITAAREMVGPSLSITTEMQRRRDMEAARARGPKLPHQFKRERERRMKRMAKAVQS